jgi:hypothetical protein
MYSLRLAIMQFLSTEFVALGMKETLQNLVGITHLLSGDSKELGSTQNPT